MDIQLIRNFAIIAHIDHGKSTLADRLLELTHVVNPGKHEDQMLDRNPISRERGITIKLAPVRMEYKKEGKGIEASMVNGNEKMEENTNLQTQLPNKHPYPITYILNLIDTPGHVDFSYEVDRTLACVEGVVLLVDATQGIQAQTIANAYKALEKDLVIIPVVNKIDMPNAETAKTKKELVDFLGVKDEEIYEVSAKTGQNVEKLLNAIIEKIPSPPSQLTNNQSPSPRFASEAGITDLRALIFDSYYDSHRGVIAFVRIFEGSMKKKQKVKLVVSQKEFEVIEVGSFAPDLLQKDILDTGEIGYVVTNLKDIHEVRVGDSLVDAKSEVYHVEGYKKVKPMVFASLFTTDTNDYLQLKKALEKLYLNDSALSTTAIYSKALGAGFRVGFLGLLHADVVRERLEREFNLSLVLTPPQVEFKFENNHYFEPYVKVMILSPQSYVGAVMQTCEEYRAKFITMDNLNQVSLIYEMPMSELISDFFDTLKSVTSGYASLDWEFIRFEPVQADKLLILLNGDEIEEFSEMVVKERSQEKAYELTKNLRELIPRQQFDIKIQAQYKGKIIASERIAPFRKNVLVKNSKLIGAGDVGRKKKLLEKQKEGKKKMKMVGHVEIPKEAFLKLFKKSSL